MRCGVERADMPGVRARAGDFWECDMLGRTLQTGANTVSSDPCAGPYRPTNFHLYQWPPSFCPLYLCVWFVMQSTPPDKPTPPSANVFPDDDAGWSWSEESQKEWRRIIGEGEEYISKHPDYFIHFSTLFPDLFCVHSFFPLI